jgi:hypothetical protein
LISRDKLKCRPFFIFHFRGISSEDEHETVLMLLMLSVYDVDRSKGLQRIL